ncbi:MAG: fatty acyl-AMP ligase [Myxococcota bacterium]
MDDTLIDVLDRAKGRTHKGYTFLDGKLEPRRWTFAQLVEEADRRALVLRDMGLEPGDRMGLIAADAEHFVCSFLGAIRAGILPVPMYPPFALDRLDAYIDQAARILDVAGAKVLVTNHTVSHLVWSLVSRVSSLRTVQTLERLRRQAQTVKTTVGFQPFEASPDDPCFLQFTSGSTSQPKGVVVTHRNLVANAHAIMRDGVNADPEDDHGVSWLPLFHDMGLIGFVVAPLLQQIRVTFIPTELFVRRPSVWMETIHRVRGTISFAPNFAFGLAAKRVTEARLKELDLSCLRVVGCGAEPINPATLQSFVGTFSRAGLAPEAVMPAYGMAEATLAITFDRLDRPFKSVPFQKHALQTDRRAIPVEAGAPPEDTAELVSCGKPFPGHAVAVMDDEGRQLEEGEVGEIALKGPSNTPGYFNDPDATERLLRDGWLYTGDLGFIVDGEVYISGRKKDMIILNGRNHYPQSIEWELERIDGIRKGNVVAFGVAQDHAEDLIVAAETRSEDHDGLKRRMKSLLQSAFGVRPKEVLLLPPGSLPKTSSGKLQRSKARALYEKAALGGEGDRSVGSGASGWALARHVTASAVARLTHGVRATRASAEPPNKDEHRD